MPTILALIDAYTDYMRNERRLAESTITSYRSDLKHLYQLVKCDVDSITLNDLRGYITMLSKRGYKVKTIRRHFHGFTTFWRWLFMERLIKPDLLEQLARIRLPTPSVVIPRWLSEDELRRFVYTPVKRPVASEALRDETAWLLLAWLGIRRGELLNIHVGDVRLGDGLIVIRGGKNKRDRLMPLPPSLCANLTALTSERAHSDYLLLGHDGHRWKVQAFARAFGQQLKRCGLAGQDVTPHTLRHTYATMLTTHGINLVGVQKMLGHVDIKSTMIYAHFDPLLLRQVMDAHPLSKGQ